MIFTPQPAITCSKLTIKTLEQGVKLKNNNKDARTMPMVKHSKYFLGNCRQIALSVFNHCCCSGVFIVNFEHIYHLVLVFLLPNLSK